MGLSDRYIFRRRRGGTRVPHNLHDHLWIVNIFQVGGGVLSESHAQLFIVFPQLHGDFFHFFRRRVVLVLVPFVEHVKSEDEEETGGDVVGN